MTKAAQVLQENLEVDFIDINMGCPIDLVFREVKFKNNIKKKKKISYQTTRALFKSN